ncbi:MAG: cytochrome c [Proteobacteria bacterium]|nr:cytochrome c [Pseudomonadota bacterium]
MRWFALLFVGVGLVSGGDVLCDDSREADEAGATLYARYCASCHGMTGRGDGPVSVALVHPPADLTRLHERYGRPLDAQRLAEWIDGRRVVPAHGVREMPIWGERLYEGAPPPSPDLEKAKRGAILLIVHHLESIQEPEP